MGKVGTLMKFKRQNGRYFLIFEKNLRNSTEGYFRGHRIHWDIEENMTPFHSIIQVSFHGVKGQRPPEKDQKRVHFKWAEGPFFIQRPP